MDLEILCESFPQNSSDLVFSQLVFKSYYSFTLYLVYLIAMEGPKSCPVQCLLHAPPPSPTLIWILNRNLIFLLAHFSQRLTCELIIWLAFVVVICSLWLVVCSPLSSTTLNHRADSLKSNFMWSISGIGELWFACRVRSHDQGGGHVHNR